MWGDDNTRQEKIDAIIVVLGTVDNMVSMYYDEYINPVIDTNLESAWKAYKLLPYEALEDVDLDDYIYLEESDSELTSLEEYSPFFRYMGGKTWPYNGYFKDQVIKFIDELVESLNSDEPQTVRVYHANHAELITLTTEIIDMWKRDIIDKHFGQGQLKG